MMTQINQTSAVATTTLTLEVTLLPSKICHIQLNRPAKGNACTMSMFREIYSVFHTIKNQMMGTPRLASWMDDGRITSDADIRAIVLSGAGKCFSTGIDISLLAENSESTAGDDAARTSLRINYSVQLLQQCLTAIEECPIPVVAAIHGPCIGLGIDIISACDIRLASKDAMFAVKEVDVGLAADVGTLQRLPLIVGNQSRVRDWVFTARTFSAHEAFSSGLVSSLHDTPAAVAGAALDVAGCIAQKSPIAVLTSKLSLNFNNKTQIRQGLDHIALANSAMLQASDPQQAVMAQMDKKTRNKPVNFSKL